MRQRHVKNRDHIMEDCNAWRIGSLEELTVPFYSLFGNDHPVFLEIGSGKGRFITEMALAHPENNYIACEGGKDISVRILQKAAELGLSNLRILTEYMSWDNCIYDPGKNVTCGQEYSFERETAGEVSAAEEPAGEASAAEEPAGEVSAAEEPAGDRAAFRESLDPDLLSGRFSGIYINFCDPWPKDRHAKRRLTYRDNLMAYRRIASPGARLYFKTDNEALFDFSLNELSAAGLCAERLSRDLHNEPYSDVNIMTEYEKKFSALGRPIFYVESILKRE